MAWSTVKYRLKSDAPLLVHNGLLASWKNPFTKAMAKINGKRKKTDADREELARLEFHGGLYQNGDGPCIPADAIEAMLLGAAKRTREGQMAKSGMFCMRDAKLEYDGPRDAESLYADERFVHQAMVRVSMNKVLRTRPVFPEWELECLVQHEDTVVSRDRLDEWMKLAGVQVGLCDWRPRYGRFHVVSIEAVEEDQPLEKAAG